MKLAESILQMRQNLPLDVKVIMAKRRITTFVEEYGLDGVYLSFSGGKDSTVLRHIATQEDMYPDMQMVFLDTWMEYPQVRQFALSFPNVHTIKPDKSMKEIIQKTGWCFPSKDVAEMIDGVRRDKPWAIRKINGLDKNGMPSEFRQQYKKWWKLVDSKFTISSQCCIEMKEKPVGKYEKDTGRKPILAIMATESARRKESYLRTGCNSFDSERPMSKPMGFFTEQDILQYIQENNIKIASPYGSIEEKGQVPGQVSLFSPCQTCPMRNTWELTGEKRTGCMFCPVGCHLPGGMEKFDRLKSYNKNLYDYCMEELGEKELLEWVKENYCS